MSELTLTKIRFAHGQWEGRLTGSAADSTPRIKVLYQDSALADIEVSPADGLPGGWDIAIPVPTAAIADGLHTFVVQDATSAEALGHFTLIGGDVDSGDLRSEVDLLRAELDMLKRAFRRHCVETAD